MSGDKEDDDTVVSEMPVFLSHTLIKKLYVFQYPTRPPALPEENVTITKCCFKPINQELLMEVSVDPNSPNYDVSHGEKIAKKIDGGKNRPDEKYFQSNTMDKTTLESTHVMVDTDNIAVATVNEGHMTIAVLKGVLSVQPSFPHMDLINKRSKKESNERGEDDSLGEEEEEVEEKITVKFSRTESDNVKKGRKQSHKLLSKRSAEEKWYQTQFHLPSSRVAEREKSMLTSVIDLDLTSFLNLSTKEYMDILVPVQEDTSKPSHFSSMLMAQINLPMFQRNLPLPDIVLAILKQVKIMTFRQLSLLMAGIKKANEVNLLIAVQQVAVLVRGNWVVRSDCLYPKGSVSPQNGVSAENMRRARDYILYQLSEGEVLKRNQVADWSGLPPEEVNDLLSQVCQLSPKEGWSLALEPDNDFIRRNPDVVARQAEAWKIKYIKLMEPPKPKVTNARKLRYLLGRQYSTPAQRDSEAPLTSGEVAKAGCVEEVCRVRGCGARGGEGNKEDSDGSTARRSRSELAPPKPSS